MKKIFITLVVAISLISCDKDALELEPISQIDAETFYSTDEEMNQATIGIYDALQAVPLREFALTEMRSDNARSNSGEGDWGQFENYTVVPTNRAIGDYWSANYNVIFRSNRVLQNIDVVSNPTLKLQLEGEAKFTRALAHFNLVRAYGAVPILDREIGVDDSEYFVRDEVTAVLDFIISDLVTASDQLPVKGVLKFGRATNTAAKALLAKVYLTTQNYSAAEALLSEIIANPNYELEPEYEDVFYNEGNDEIIFAIPYINDDLYESQDFSFEMTAGGVRSGLNYLTGDFIANLDPDDTIRRPILQNQRALEENGKFLTSSANARLCGNDWIVLRLADVYLMFVEAKLAGFQATQNIEAIEAYNKVRERVKLSTTPTDGSGDISLTELLNERRYELAFENHRFYDLVRTGRANSTLRNYAASAGYIFTSTDLLLPLPQAEINVSRGLLVQNPGY